jgi:hypothetical protein
MVTSFLPAFLLSVLYSPSRICRSIQESFISTRYLLDSQGIFCVVWYGSAPSGSRILMIYAADFSQSPGGSSRKWRDFM